MAQTICPETGVPVYHAKTRYGCDCSTCTAAWESGDPDGVKARPRPDGTTPDLGTYVDK